MEAIAELARADFFPSAHQAWRFLRSAKRSGMRWVGVREYAKRLGLIINPERKCNELGREVDFFRAPTMSM